MEEKIILVDENDNEIGIGEKIKTHQNGGRLHRAISVFVFNSKGEILLQRRAETKYHCPGLWSNTCCSHPRPGEETIDTAHRRLKEEMGFDCDLKKVFDFIYKTDFDNGLSEWEFDHVFIGKFDGQPSSDPKEVKEWKWTNLENLKKDIKERSQDYTYWFKLAFEKLRNGPFILKEGILSC